MQIQLGEKFQAILQTHSATFFNQYAKYTKKYDFINSMQVAQDIHSTKISDKCGYFRIKNYIYQRNGMIFCGAAAIFSAITMSDFIKDTEIIRKQKRTRYYAWMNDLESYSSFARKY